jgi:hypothetical protein
MALSAPVSGGDQLNPADIDGHTLIIIPVEWQADVPTEYSKPGEPSPCITCNVADLSAEGGTPVVYRGVMWWNAMLQGGLKRQLGQTILGRMQQGQKSPGKNAPWQLLDVMTEADWVAYAESWLAKPEGVAFEQEGQAAAAAAAGKPTVSAPAPASAPPAAAPPSAGRPPAPAGPPTAPAGPPASAPAPAPVAAPPAPAGPPAAAPAGDLAAQLAGLPADEVAKMLAALQNQGQAAH